MTGRRGNGEGSIFRTRDRAGYTGMLDLGPGPDGKRIRRKVRGGTKSEVAEKLKKLRQEHDGRPGTTGTLRTVGELAKSWLETSARSRLGVFRGEVVPDGGEGGCWCGPFESAVGSVVIVEVDERVVAGVALWF